jgi:two-component system cell cycle response regulator DivK
MQDLSTWNVLIVDDEPDNIGVVKLVLEFNDVTVWAASSGQEGLVLLETHRPTLALIDIAMPEMSGVALLGKIREHPEWPRFPVIAMTAYSMQGDRERIMEAGFDGYIGKPINALTLVDELVAMMAGSTRG